MTNSPWTDGPQELIQHAVDHLALRGDFDRRMAMISIDNAVELMIKTYLGLPKRARGTQGPSRRELETASESFPALLDLLETYSSDKLVGIGLDDIEWFHRIRNQLYHAGNGITVELSKVEAYLQIATTLFENLYGHVILLDTKGVTRTKTGEFLQIWNEFQQLLREKMPPKEVGEYTYYRKVDFLGKIKPDFANLYQPLSNFRNALVHGLETPEVKVIDHYITEVKQIMKAIKQYNP